MVNYMIGRRAGRRAGRQIKGLLFSQMVCRLVELMLNGW